MMKMKVRRSLLGGRRSLLGGLWILDSVFGLGLNSKRANRSARLKKGSKLTYRTKDRCEQIKKSSPVAAIAATGELFEAVAVGNPSPHPLGANMAS